MTAVLVIDDDVETTSEIAAKLTQLGYAVECVCDGSEGLRRACEESWDVMVVDRMLPGLDGLSLIRELRIRDIVVPALVLSALHQVHDRIDGLRAGGDDYLIKPFALGELAARVECLARRPVDSGRTVLHVGPVAMDLITRTASRGQRPLYLLPREFQLLEFLIRRGGQVVTRQMLLEHVFGYRFELKSNLVDVHMGRLRRKLDQPGEAPMLETRRGLGFVLHVPG